MCRFCVAKYISGSADGSKRLTLRRRHVRQQSERLLATLLRFVGGVGEADMDGIIIGELGEAAAITGVLWPTGIGAAAAAA
jgi:hypothetical protein